MKRKLTAIILACACLASPAQAKQKPIRTKVISEMQLTDKMLATRKQNRIQYIEVQVCKVTNAKRKVGVCGLGSKVDLKTVPGKLHKGDIVTSYLVWNPETNLEDDVITSWCSVECKHN